MGTTKMKMTIAKITEEELIALNKFLNYISNVVKYETVVDNSKKSIKKKIGRYTLKKFSPRAASVGMINLAILLDTYQDKDGDTLQHPAWIMDMIGLIEDIGTIIDRSGSIHIQKGSMMDERIKKMLKEEE